MKKGYLSDYFVGISAKRLSKVETDPGTSNQHEFNGVTDFKKILGAEKRTFSALFIYFGENEEETISQEGFLTWYDARENHPTRSEYRFYFPATSVTDKAETDDMVFIARRPDDGIIVIVTQANSTVENQLLWLFGFKDEGDLFSNFSVKSIEGQANKTIEFVAGFILDHIGIEIADDYEKYLDILLKTFPDGFPATKVFSGFARGNLDISSIDNPDMALIAWMEHEEILFKTLEKYLLSDRLKMGFKNVDEFVSVSLSVQNRRKSRAGHAFENHLEKVFEDHKMEYSRNKTTEGNSKPDFIFPGIQEYHDTSFSVKKLSMLGVKTTCKDRWRQILTEAQKISIKHLATLEPGISTNQTDEMATQNVRLVLPQNIHDTYSSTQRKELMSIRDFISYINKKT